MATAKKSYPKDRKKALAELKEMLLDERKRLVAHLMKLEGESAKDLQNPVHGDSADIAAMEQAQASLSKLGSRESRLLKKIDHALAKFDDDEYGICELTGEEIPLPRLYARPVAQYTVEAKEELERKERGYRAPEENPEDGSGVDEID